MDSFDLEDLTNLEQAFYDKGYADGYAHGRIHGLIEGHALGCEKGYELWEEVGFYKGFAQLWQAVFSTSDPQSRSMHHITSLLELIAKFPVTNPSDAATSPTPSTIEETPDVSEGTVDITKTLTLIRSRYRALCANLGVKPRLRAIDVPQPSIDTTLQDSSKEGLHPLTSKKPINRIWAVNPSQRHSNTDDLAF